MQTSILVDRNRYLSLYERLEQAFYSQWSNAAAQNICNSFVDSMMIDNNHEIVTDDLIADLLSSNEVWEIAADCIKDTKRVQLPNGRYIMVDCPTARKVRFTLNAYNHITA